MGEHLVPPYSAPLAQVIFSIYDVPDDWMITYLKGKMAEWARSGSW